MSKKRGPYSSPRQQERRKRILEAAAVQLEKHGFSALSMQSVAEASDVSTKTLYNLFASLDLLLLDAASQHLVDLQKSSHVLDAEPGILRLVAYASASVQRFEKMPEYARTVISILIRAELDSDAAYARFGPIQRFAYSSLCIAAENNELRADLDLQALSYVFSANEWGAVLLWEKGLLTVEQLEPQIRLNNLLTLIPLCLGKRKKFFEKELAKLFETGVPAFPDLQLATSGTN
jgi:AcrR family transcriptional regulator